MRDVEGIYQLNIPDGSIVFVSCTSLAVSVLGASVFISQRAPAPGAGPESKLEFLKSKNGVAASEEV